MTIDRDDTAWIHPTTVFEGEAAVGFCSRVGHGATAEEPVRIGNAPDWCFLHHRGWSTAS
jgi:hypothetical protein